MMEKVKSPLAVQLKNELMDRYGLREDQIRLELAVFTTNLDLGRQILTDFDNSELPEPYLADEKANCDWVYGECVDTLWVHRKDGRYAEYIVKEGEEDAES